MSNLSKTSRHQLRLRGGAGCRDAVAGAVLVHGRAADHAVDPVTVRQRRIQRLQHQHSRRLPRHEAVRTLVERAALAGRREHAGIAGDEIKGGRRHQRDTTGERHRAFTSPQALAGEMDRHERGGAGRVDREAGTSQVEMVGDARRQHRGRVAHEALRIRQPAHALEIGRIVAGDRADEDAGFRLAQPRGRTAGVLERMPRLLEKDPLLRVHGHGIGRREAEEGRVEGGHVAQKSPVRATRAAGHERVGIIDRGMVPALARHRPDAASARREIVPEGPDIVRPGEAPGHADDGDRLPRRVGAAAGVDPRHGRRLVRRRPSRRHRLREAHAMPIRQMSGQSLDRRVAEEDGGLEVDAEATAQRLHERHAQHQIGPVVGETFVGAEIGKPHLQRLGDQLTYGANKLGGGGLTCRHRLGRPRRDVAAPTRQPAAAAHAAEGLGPPSPRSSRRAPGSRFAPR